MSKMHGPDQDVALIAVVPGVAPGLLAPASMTLADLYKIIYDRLDNVRADFHREPGDSNELSDYIDIEAVTQQAMVEVRKKLGLLSPVEVGGYQNEMSGMVPPARKRLFPDRVDDMPIEPEEKSVARYYDHANMCWVDIKE